MASVKNYVFKMEFLIYFLTGSMNSIDTIE